MNASNRYGAAADVGPERARGSCCASAAPPSLCCLFLLSLSQLPYSIKVLLESAVRNADEFAITSADVEKIVDWAKTSKLQVEIPFKPARVLMQDFTGVPGTQSHTAGNKRGGRPDRERRTHLYTASLHLRCFSLLLFPSHIVSCLCV